MSPLRRSLALLVPVACLLATPVPVQEPKSAVKASLIKRDRLVARSRQLRAEGKPPEALAAAEAMLAIERKVAPAGDPIRAAWLNWLADLYVEREDFAAAKAARRESLEILAKLHGEAHREVTDVRLALQDAKRQAGMTRAQRQRRAEAAELNWKVVAIFRAGKAREAWPAARRALAVRKELLGERHPEYASSLNNLAMLLREQGDHATARLSTDRP